MKIDFENQILAFFDSYFWPFNKSHEKTNPFLWSVQSYHQSEMFLSNSVDMMKNLPMWPVLKSGALIRTPSSSFLFRRLYHLEMQIKTNHQMSRIYAVRPLKRYLKILFWDIDLLALWVHKQSCRSKIDYRDSVKVSLIEKIWPTCYT